MMKAAVLVALLLAVQACRRGRGARRLHQDPLSSIGNAKASGTDTAGAAGGGSVDGATKTAIGGLSASASGTEAQTELAIENNSGTSSGSVITGGAASGANGASITSQGQVDTKPNSALTIAFTNGAAFGAGAQVESATETNANTPWGTVTSTADVAVASEIAAYGSTMGNSISGYGGLFSQSQAVGLNREGRYGNALAVAATVGGYGPGPFSAATTATTSIDGTYAKSDGTALFTAPYGTVSVFVRDSARP
ncbi:hypothetical protein C2E21_1395 [Chlorella sorokiniana]|uniref:Uncharacterized protein n=1 Tax=Chlorella sorokiniana TaxID=3076 RepID=A0A2P6U0C2_CHLSO|nr:hypothetical protein C2E21_1395 [Chlorella sorokiniana]|eukprot:PRW59754.1 hypothetical protein C2E21_1395 [Chlorella sorokiniana]